MVIDVLVGVIWVLVALTVCSLILLIAIQAIYKFRAWKKLRASTTRHGRRNFLRKFGNETPFNV